MARYVGTVAQQGILPLDGLGGPLPETIGRTWEALMTVHASSAYEQADVNRILRRKTGMAHVAHYLNFVEEESPIRPTSAFDALSEGESAIVPGPSVASTFLQYGMTLLTDGENVAMRLFADSRLLPAGAIDDLLLSVRHAIQET
jgi:hypothetical protein